MSSQGQPSSSDIEIFKEDLEDNMHHLRDNIKELDERDRGFARSLWSYYDTHSELSPKQMPWACKFWQQINQAVGGSEVEPTEGRGKMVKSLLDQVPSDLPDNEE